MVDEDMSPQKRAEREWAQQEAEEKYAALFRSGQKLAILQCLTFCEEYDVPIPTWLRTELAGAADRYLEGISANFHDALFGVVGKRAGRHAQMSTERRERLMHQHWFDIYTALRANDLKGDAVYRRIRTLVSGRYPIKRNGLGGLNPEISVETETMSPKAPTAETIKKRIEKMKREGAEPWVMASFYEWDLSRKLRRGQKPST